MHKVSLGYQGERQEMESTDLTPIVIRALQRCVDERGDVLSFGDVSVDPTPLFIQTRDITEAARAIAEEEESGIDIERITSKRIGWILKRLRVRIKREAHTGKRGWIISRLELQKYFTAFNLYPPEKTSPNDKTSPIAEDARTERFVV